MAKSHKAKVAKYCVEQVYPEHGPHPVKGEGCTRSLAKAKALLRTKPRYDDPRGIGDRHGGVYYWRVVKRVAGKPPVDMYTEYPRARKWRDPRPRHFPTQPW